MRKCLTYNGRSSLDCGLIIDGAGTYNAPRRDTESVEVAGRNGSLTVDNGRWENVTVSYSVAVYGEEFRARMDAVRAWLLSGVGYMRLEDDYHPDEYRMARYSGRVEWDVNMLARTGQTTLEFDCWPQRFLRHGAQAVQVSNGGVLYNPTQFAALPLLELTLTGDAKLQIGDVPMSIAGYTGKMLIDCELQDAYRDGANLNRYLTAPEFPQLARETRVSWTGGISSLLVTPRWWTI